MLISMMLMASSAALEASIAATRRASNLQEHLRAARAADTALELCVRALTEGNAPVLAAVAHEPVEWQNMDAQDEAVLFTPLRSWPGSARSPQCLIEAWCPVSRPLAQAYQVTARGFGASETAQVWLQLTIVEEAGVRKRHWRRIAEPPR
jgi:Tfp pilus assembly protein PilX